MLSVALDDNNLWSRAVYLIRNYFHIIHQTNLNVE